MAAGKIVEPDRIHSGIRQNGVARVLVKFATPEYEQLATESKRFQGGPFSGTSAVQQQAADKRLAQAINGAATQTFSRLPAGVEQRHVFSTIPFAVAEVTKEGLDALNNDPSVLLVEEDKAWRLPDPVVNTDNPSPPSLATSTVQIGAAAAWALGYTGAGQYVAVLDTGILNTHEFFTGKTIVEACYTTKDSSYNPTSTLCPGGTDEEYGTGSAAHYSTDSYHGTHVAGIAAGKKPDGTLAGVAKDADLIAVKVFSDGFDKGTYGATILSWSSDQIRGMEYVYSLRNTYNIASVNMSLGGGYYSSACDTDSRKSVIDNLRGVGIATVIASGNNGYCDYVNSPGCISTSVAVGAVNSSDVEASFNNWADGMVPLVAPGVSIYSSYGASTTSYASMSGTSMATPHVAGAWAILKQMAPTGSVAQLLNAFTGAAASFTSLCTNASIASKRIQVDAALALFSVLPSVTTNTSPETSVTSVQCGGTLVSSGGAAVSEMGVCWMPGAGTPTINDSKVAASTTTLGAFSVNVMDLSPSTSYSLRAYATNTNGTSYGDVATIVTLAPPVPALTPWILLVFALLLAGGAVWALRRRIVRV
jgi:subtilisin family serine protease